MGAITVTNLGKAYKQYPTRWARLKEWLMPFSGPHHQLKWVLQNISFTVNAGEAVGIIGINGAGKSTLLKMITGTTQPTKGSVVVTGRVAALLELGMGFHPDFTGRQNVYMAGQLLGMSVEEIGALMPDIEAFAEIGDYMDQPVRVYSSGMQMRVAFSVATARRPDILIVDEALSVGDAYFQHKSFERIRSFRSEGTTLLIVSHDKAAIQAICDAAILINAGEIATMGKPDDVMDYYNALLAEHGNRSIRQQVFADGRIKTLSGTGEATVTSVKLLNEKDESVELVDVGALVRLQVKVEVKASLSRIVLGYMIKDRLGQSIFGTNTYLKGKPVEELHSGDLIDFTFAFPMSLGEGNYSLSLALHEDRTHIGKCYFFDERIMIFSVVNMSHDLFVGCAWLDPTVTISIAQEG